MYTSSTRVLNSFMYTKCYLSGVTLSLNSLPALATCQDGALARVELWGYEETGKKRKNKDGVAQRAAARVSFYPFPFLIGTASLPLVLPNM